MIYYVCCKTFNFLSIQSIIFIVWQTFCVATYVIIMYNMLSICMCYLTASWVENETLISRFDVFDFKLNHFVQHTLGHSVLFLSMPYLLNSLYSHPNLLLNACYFISSPHFFLYSFCGGVMSETTTVSASSFVWTHLLCNFRSHGGYTSTTLSLSTFSNISSTQMETVAPIYTPDLGSAVMTAVNPAYSSFYLYYVRVCSPCITPLRLSHSGIPGCKGGVYTYHLIFFLNAFSSSVTFLLG